MRVFENQEFCSGNALEDRDSGAVFDGFEFRHCYFESSFVSMTKNPALRSIIRNVQLVDCAQRGCSVQAAIIENVHVDGFKTNGQLFQTFGAVFKHVVLRGKIDRLMLSNDVLPSMLLNEVAHHREIRIFREANAEYYRHVDWALDISQGEFKELDIREVPAHLIRRDPETQVVVTRQRALQENWRDIEFRMAVMPFSLDFLLRWESQDMVLIAPKRHPKFRDYLEDLRMLRKAGVAEPD